MINKPGIQASDTRFKLVFDAPHRLLLSGELDAGSVIKARAEGEAYIETMRGCCVLDLKALQSAHSMVLSLVLCWLRAAQRQGVELAIEGMSERLYDMARVSGLDALLPIGPCRTVA